MTFSPFRAFRQQVLPRLLCVGLVGGLYALAFFLPVLQGGGFLGHHAFGHVLGELLGWSPPFVPPKPEEVTLLIGFLPNPLLWVGLVVLFAGWRRVAAAFGALAVAAALVWMIEFHEKVTLHPAGLNVGYYCWVSSMVALTVCSSTLHILGRAQPAMEYRPPPPFA